MSDKPHPATERQLRLPPANFKELTVPVTKLAAQNWYRVHHIRFKAIYFSRNPSHRFSHAAAPFPCLYVGGDVETCLMERFGDIVLRDHRLALSEWETSSLSRISVPRLQVCDLTDSDVRIALGVEEGALMHPNLANPQLWGKALQEHPTNYDGILYLSRFTVRPCLVIFQKPDLVLQEQSLGNLTTLDEPSTFLTKHKIALL